MDIIKVQKKQNNLPNRSFIHKFEGQDLTLANKPTKSNFKFSKTFFILLFLLLGVIGVSTYFFYTSKENQLVLSEESVKPQSDIHTLFLMEIFDKVKENFWKKTTDSELAKLYKLAAEKILETPQILKSEDRSGLIEMLENALMNKSSEQKKDFTVKMATVVLANLEPFGRSGLYTNKKETELTNLVNNIDPETDLYNTLGITKDASNEEINKAVTEKNTQLKTILENKNSTPAEKETASKELDLVKRAQDTLTTEQTKKNYDEVKVEAAVVGELIQPDVFYIRFKKFTPNCYNELIAVAQTMDGNIDENLNTLIFDLRGNIGGSIDLLQYFLGPFIGMNNVAFEFFHQDNYTPYKTVAGWLQSLVRYKKVVILIDSQTQSSAEMMAAALKRYNVGVLLGEKTKGWGTVEMIYGLDNQIATDEKYSIFLVNSITLRDDNQPIEGRGIEPTISISDPNWEKELNAYYNSPSLIRALKKIYAK